MDAACQAAFDVTTISTQTATASYRDQASQTYIYDSAFRNGLVSHSRESVSYGRNMQYFNSLLNFKQRRNSSVEILQRYQNATAGFVDKSCSSPDSVFGVESKNPSQKFTGYPTEPQDLSSTLILSDELDTAQASLSSKSPKQLTYTGKPNQLSNEFLNFKLCDIISTDEDSFAANLEIKNKTSDENSSTLFSEGCSTLSSESGSILFSEDGSTMFSEGSTLFSEYGSERFCAAGGIRVSNKCLLSTSNIIRNSDNNESEVPVVPFTVRYFENNGDLTLTNHLEDDSSVSINMNNNGIEDWSLAWSPVTKDFRFEYGNYAMIEEDIKHKKSASPNSLPSENIAALFNISKPVKMSNEYDHKTKIPKHERYFTFISMNEDANSSINFSKKRSLKNVSQRTADVTSDIVPSDDSSINFTKNRSLKNVSQGTADVTSDFAPTKDKKILDERITNVPNDQHTVLSNFICQNMDPESYYKQSKSNLVNEQVSITLKNEVQCMSQNVFSENHSTASAIISNSHFYEKDSPIIQIDNQDCINETIFLPTVKAIPANEVDNEGQSTIDIKEFQRAIVVNKEQFAINIEAKPENPLNQEQRANDVNEFQQTIYVQKPLLLVDVNKNSVTSNKQTEVPTNKKQYTIRANKTQSKIHELQLIFHENEQKSNFTNGVFTEVHVNEQCNNNANKAQPTVAVNQKQCTISIAENKIKSNSDIPIIVSDSKNKSILINEEQLSDDNEEESIHFKNIDINIEAKPQVNHEQSAINDNEVRITSPYQETLSDVVVNENNYAVISNSAVVSNKDQYTIHANETQSKMNEVQLIFHGNEPQFTVTHETQTEVYINEHNEDKCELHPTVTVNQNQSTTSIVEKKINLTSEVPRTLSVFNFKSNIVNEKHHYINDNQEQSTIPDKEFKHVIDVNKEQSAIYIEAEPHMLLNQEHNAIEDQHKIPVQNTIHVIDINDENSDVSSEEKPKVPINIEQYTIDANKTQTEIHKVQLIFHENNRDYTVTNEVCKEVHVNEQCNNVDKEDQPTVTVNQKQCTISIVENKIQSNSEIPILVSDSKNKSILSNEEQHSDDNEEESIHFKKFQLVIDVNKDQSDINIEAKPQVNDEQSAINDNEVLRTTPDRETLSVIVINENNSAVNNNSAVSSNSAVVSNKDYYTIHDDETQSKMNEVQLIFHGNKQKFTATQEAQTEVYINEHNEDKCEVHPTVIVNQNQLILDVVAEQYDVADTQSNFHFCQAQPSVSDKLAQSIILSNKIAVNNEMQTYVSGVKGQQNDVDNDTAEYEKKSQQNFQANNHHSEVIHEIEPNVHVNEVHCNIDENEEKLVVNLSERQSSYSKENEKKNLVNEFCFDNNEEIYSVQPQLIHEVNKKLCSAQLKDPIKNAHWNGDVKEVEPAIQDKQSRRNEVQPKDPGYKVKYAADQEHSPIDANKEQFTISPQISKLLNVIDNDEQTEVSVNNVINSNKKTYFSEEDELCNSTNLCNASKQSGEDISNRQTQHVKLKENENKNMTYNKTSKVIVNGETPKTSNLTIFQSVPISNDQELGKKSYAKSPSKCFLIPNRKQKIPHNLDNIPCSFNLSVSYTDSESETNDFLSKDYSIGNIISSLRESTLPEPKFSSTHLYSGILLEKHSVRETPSDDESNSLNSVCEDVFIERDLPAQNSSQNGTSHSKLDPIAEKAFDKPKSRTGESKRRKKNKSPQQKKKQKTAPIESTNSENLYQDNVSDKSVDMKVPINHLGNEKIKTSKVDPGALSNLLQESLLDKMCRENETNTDAPIIKSKIKKIKSQSTPVRSSPRILKLNARPNTKKALEAQESDDVPQMGVKLMSSNSSSLITMSSESLESSTLGNDKILESKNIAFRKLPKYRLESINNIFFTPPVAEAPKKKSSKENSTFAVDLSQVVANEETDFNSSKTLNKKLHIKADCLREPIPEETHCISINSRKLRSKEKISKDESSMEISAGHQIKKQTNPFKFTGAKPKIINAKKKKERLDKNVHEPTKEKLENEKKTSLNKMEIATKIKDDGNDNLQKQKEICIANEKQISLSEAAEKSHKCRARKLNPPQIDNVTALKSIAAEKLKVSQQETRRLRTRQDKRTTNSKVVRVAEKRAVPTVKHSGITKENEVDGNPEAETLRHVNVLKGVSSKTISEKEKVASALSHESSKMRVIVPIVKKTKATIKVNKAELNGEKQEVKKTLRKKNN